MACFAYELTGPTGLIFGFFVSEVIALLSLAFQEGLDMVETIYELAAPYAICVLDRIIKSAERHLLSYRLSLLMSL